MSNITLISTTHNEEGQCNADALCRIIYDHCPDVIFLEAMEDTYSAYQRNLFENFRVFHPKLEIAAIQKYGTLATFYYKPVLDFEMPEAFDNKYKIVCENHDHQTAQETYKYLTLTQGFKFLNSDESSKLQEEMRALESALLNYNEINKAAIESIDAYECSMVKNIYSYCENHEFNSAIFMCGVAHRNSIFHKIKNYNHPVKNRIKWELFKH